MGATEVPSQVHGDAKVGLHSFVVKVLAENFHLPDDAQVLLDFHDMHRVMRCKNLDVAQVTLFAL